MEDQTQYLVWEKKSIHPVLFSENVGFSFYCNFGNLFKKRKKNYVLFITTNTTNTTKKKSFQQMCDQLWDTASINIIDYRWWIYERWESGFVLILSLSLSAVKIYASIVPSVGQRGGVCGVGAGFCVSMPSKHRTKHNKPWNNRVLHCNSALQYFISRVCGCSDVHHPSTLQL